MCSDTPTTLNCIDVIAAVYESVIPGVRFGIDLPFVALYVITLQPPWIVLVLTSVVIKGDCSIKRVVVFRDLAIIVRYCFLRFHICIYRSVGNCWNKAIKNDNIYRRYAINEIFV